MIFRRGYKSYVYVLAILKYSVQCQEPQVATSCNVNHSQSTATCQHNCRRQADIYSNMVKTLPLSDPEPAATQVCAYA
jgi:hypothetical protein